jgi:Acyl-CoA synthetases (AMP-forming)/AMP-acid ligases II
MDRERPHFTLWNAATCEILPRFRAVDVWERLARCEVTLWVAVPTVYRRLIDQWYLVNSEAREAWRQGAQACRLMVSGSAALPVPTLESWDEITGHPPPCFFAGGKPPPPWGYLTHWRGNDDRALSGGLYPVWKPGW